MSTVKYYNQSTGQWEHLALGKTGPQGSKGDKGDQGDIGPQGVAGNPKPDLISRIQYPVYVAHRNAPKLYPEESMEGQRLMAEKGFPIEIDVAALSDGTLVACHDATVNRTMDNIGTGNVSSKTPAEWRKALIKPAIKGGRQGTPIFFENWLDEFGGKYLLVPELKAGTNAYAQDFIDAIKNRGIEESVLAQSFDWEIAKMFANQGLHTVFLVAGTLTQTPAAIAAEGIEFVSGNLSLSATDISALKAQGLKVIIYTANTKAAARTAINTKGADGVLSDDPEYVSDLIIPKTTSPFGEGYGWPGALHIDNQEPDNEAAVAGTVSLLGDGLYFTDGQTTQVTQDWAGRIDTPCRISFEIDYGIVASSQTRSYGITLYNNANDDEAMFYDGAMPGQQAYTFVARRNGQLQAWYFEPNADPVSIGATSNSSTPFAVAGDSGKAFVTIEIANGMIAMRETRTGKYAAWGDTHAYKNLRLALRTTESGGFISNVKVERM